MQVIQRGAGANMSVDVSVGDVAIANTSVMYWGWSDAVNNVIVTAANATNPRKDTIVAYVDLAVVSSASNDNPGALKFICVAGTAAASPVASNDATIQAAVGALNPFLRLGVITLPALAASVVTAYLSDSRVSVAFKGQLWGGSSNTAGHTVPNVADDTLALLNATQTFNGAHTFGSGTPVEAAWSSFTPTWTNVSGGTATFSKYFQIGKTVHFRMKYTLAGAGVTGSIIFTTPNAMHADLAAGSTINATANFYDVSSTNIFPATVTWQSSTTLGLFAQATGGTYNSVASTSSTIPFTWASGDIIEVWGTYQAA